MNQLWQWTATDQYGKSRKYQAYSPSETESQMLEHLQGAFRNLRITGLERLPDSAYLPPTGPVESHAFDYGHMRRAEHELGYPVAKLFKPPRKLIERRPIVRASIIPR